MNYDLTSVEQIAALLDLRGREAVALRDESQRVKMQHVGEKVYLRGLVEYSNVCSKNCYYCGIRCANSDLQRYTLSREEVLQAAEYAYKNGFGSLVLQAGERQDEIFVCEIESLIREIMRISNGELGITLSLGEQSRQTYRRWRRAGALRYLLRIETSSPPLYARLHPQDHSFEKRRKCLQILREEGYQVGSGIMIGLPFQNTEQVARDLLFLKETDVDMVGMGPYIEHAQTPLYSEREQLLPPQERYALCLNAWAVLRLLMPDINIASTTALASLHPQGREEVLRIAANVIMPNITPKYVRANYKLYENKICIENPEEDSLENIQELIRRAGCEPALFEQGNSPHYKMRS